MKNKKIIAALAVAIGLTGVGVFSYGAYASGVNGEDVTQGTSQTGDTGQPTDAANGEAVKPGENDADGTGAKGDADGTGANNAEEKETASTYTIDYGTYDDADIYTPSNPGTYTTGKKLELEIPAKTDYTFMGYEVHLGTADGKDVTSGSLKKESRTASDGTEYEVYTLDTTGMTGPIALVSVFEPVIQDKDGKDVAEMFSADENGLVSKGVFAYNPPEGNSIVIDADDFQRLKKEIDAIHPSGIGYRYLAPGKDGNDSNVGVLSFSPLK